MTLQEFYKKIDTEKADDYLVWIKYKYNHEIHWDYIVEYLEYNGNRDEYIWLNDWHEGQEDVEILGYIAMGDLRYDMIKWEEINMNKEEIEKLEWHISHNINYIEKQRMILEKLDKLFPNKVEDYLVDTNAGHCKLTYAEIFDIKTAVRCNMEECASWVECKTKKLEELKNGKAKEE